MWQNYTELYNFVVQCYRFSPVCLFMYAVAQRRQEKKIRFALEWQLQLHFTVFQMFCFGNQMELSFEEFKAFYKPKRHCNCNNFLLLSLIQLIQIAIESILL